VQVVDHPQNAAHDTGHDRREAAPRRSRWSANAQRAVEQHPELDRDVAEREQPGRPRTVSLREYSGNISEHEGKERNRKRHKMLRHFSAESPRRMTASLMTESVPESSVPAKAGTQFFLVPGLDSRFRGMSGSASSPVDSLAISLAR